GADPEVRRNRCCNRDRYRADGRDCLVDLRDAPPARAARLHLASRFALTMHGTIDSLLQAERRPLSELASLADDWRALMSRALEPNGFYEPAFALAAAPIFGRDAQVILIRSRQSPARLVGLFPVRVTRRYGLGPSVLTGWLH